jgi:hypothetical protein
MVPVKSSFEKESTLSGTFCGTWRCISDISQPVQREQNIDFYDSVVKDMGGG